jgi:hypothetical protein
LFFEFDDRVSLCLQVRELGLDAVGDFLPLRLYVADTQPVAQRNEHTDVARKEGSEFLLVVKAEEQQRVFAAVVDFEVNGSFFRDGRSEETHENRAVYRRGLRVPQELGDVFGLYGLLVLAFEEQHEVSVFEPHVASPWLLPDVRDVCVLVLLAQGVGYDVFPSPAFNLV